MKRRVFLLVISVFFAAVLIGGCYLGLLWRGVLHLNNPSPEEYPVQGVDVSSYQGSIDWEMIASKNLQFAFIKATEGSGFVDSFFEQNFHGARNAGLVVGAYHFFSFDSPGKTQADNFIRTVPKVDGTLPPVIDLEFYGAYSTKEQAPPSQEVVLEQLQILLTRLSEHYGQQPIIYTTEKMYDQYLNGVDLACDFWISDVISEPSLPDGKPWRFWQYTTRGRLPGFHGAESFIDLDVFCGSEAEFEDYF